MCGKKKLLREMWRVACNVTSDRIWYELATVVTGECEVLLERRSLSMGVQRRARVDTVARVLA